MTFPIFGVTIGVTLLIGIFVLTLIYMDSKNILQGVKRDGVIFGYVMLLIGIVGLIIKVLLCSRAPNQITSDA